MRILCLHGMGVNAKIFAAQTARFRQLLPSDYEFVFYDGYEECEPASAISNLYSGPFYCWYSTPTTARVALAHRYVLEFIRSQGPFDGIMGFSQGAALAASMLLQGHSAMFRFAIFICSPLPFATNLEHGIDTRAYFGSPAVEPVGPDWPTKVPDHLVTHPDYLRGEERLARDNKSSANVSSGFAKPDVNSYYQMFHPTADGMRISIPTGHIVGAKDKWRLHSLDMVGLCDPSCSAVFEHQGGHEIPKDTSEDICDLIESVVFYSS